MSITLLVKNLAKEGYTEDQIDQIVQEYNQIADKDKNLSAELLHTPTGKDKVVSKTLADIINKVVGEKR